MQPLPVEARTQLDIQLERGKLSKESADLVWKNIEAQYAEKTAAEERKRLEEEINGVVSSRGAGGVTEELKSSEAALTAVNNEMDRLRTTQDYSQETTNRVVELDTMRIGILERQTALKERQTQLSEEELDNETQLNFLKTMGAQLEASVWSATVKQLNTKGE